MVKEIQLTKGYIALVDDGDYAHLSVFKWYPDIGKYTVYALRHDYSVKPRRTLSMHREVMGLPSGKVDHKDHNGLNNQKHNLRVCGINDNARNSIKPITGATSKYKGVSWKAANKKWVAQINVEGHSKHIGIFDSELDAAIAYDKVAIELYGEFALINFLPVGDHENS